MKNKKVKFIVDAAVIAALYVVLTYLAAAFNLSSGVIQGQILGSADHLACLHSCRHSGLVCRLYSRQRTDGSSY